tara:strand:- start:179643 stop:180194 length:552 start_codon:yes stop_codon:yes gene_type:complete
MGISNRATSPMKTIARHLLLAATLSVAFFACKEPDPTSSVKPVNWKERFIELNESDSLVTGSTYLSVYSQIYSRSESRTHDLTATISMRNTSLTDSIYMLKADYYNTHGELLRTYFKNPIFISPMETIEIVIDEVDNEGGTGANFIFEWAVKDKTHEPLFEAVMISTSGQQGISFTTQGVSIQ